MTDHLAPPHRSGGGAHGDRVRIPAPRGQPPRGGKGGCARTRRREALHSPHRPRPEPTSPLAQSRRGGWRPYDVQGPLACTRPFRIRLELGAQAGYVIVNRAGGGKSCVAPNNVEKPFPADRFAFGFNQETEHGEFLGREMNLLSASPGLLPLEIHPHPAEPHLLEGRGGMPGSAQQGTNPGQ